MLFINNVESVMVKVRMTKTQVDFGELQKVLLTPDKRARPWERKLNINKY